MQPFPFELLYFSMSKLNFPMKNIKSSLLNLCPLLILDLPPSPNYSPIGTVTFCGGDRLLCHHSFSLLTQEIQKQLLTRTGTIVHSVQYKLLPHHSSSRVTNGLMEKVGKFKPTCLWHRLNPKERAK